MPVSSLRNQITETQKIRSDLLKWKLVLVSGIGAVGLGIQEGAEHNEILLGLIPLVCVYVDALCAHLSLRIRAIGVFMVVHPTTNADEQYAQNYERFIRLWTPERHLALSAADKKNGIDGKDQAELKRGGNRLEPIALLGSTLLLSALVLGYGIQMMCRTSQPVSPTESVVPVALAVSGVIGIVISIMIGCFHDVRVALIRAEAEEYIRSKVGKADGDSVERE
jgi:hypothetical protein